MADFLLKVIELLVSAKTAARFVFGSVVALTVLLLVYPKFSTSYGSMGVPSELVSALFILLGFGFGSLILEFAVWSGDKILKKWRNYRKALTNKKEREARIKAEQELCRQVLPHLLPEQKKILDNFNNGLVEIGASSSIGQTLEECKFIKLVLKIDAYKGLYRLNPAIQPIVESYFNESRKKYLSDRLGRVSKNECEFLQLFAQPTPSLADQPEHPFLEHRVYLAAQDLIADQVLIRETDRTLGKYKEKVRLMEDAISIIEENIIKTGIKRDSIILDFSRIAASSNAAGSGAGPNLRNT